MELKLRILLGILIAGILLIAGWNFISTPVNKGYCKSDEDCKFTCGCGCIPKNKVCPIRVFCRPTICGSACRCENGECKSWADVYKKAVNTKNIELCKEIRDLSCREFCLEMVREKLVTITTDKTEYGQGEIVKIIVENKDSEKISLCRYPTLESPIFSIEKFENGTWITVCCVGPCKCHSPCMVRIMKCLEIQPNQTIEFEWHQKKETCKNSQYISAQADLGKYRIRFNIGTALNPIYSNEFTIK